MSGDIEISYPRALGGPGEEHLFDAYLVKLCLPKDL
jgi:hypothetical protein